MKELPIKNSRRHSTATKTSKCPSSYQFGHIPRQTTEQAPKAEDSVSKDEARLASEDVAHLSVQRPKLRCSVASPRNTSRRRHALEAGQSQHVPRSDPTRILKLFELAPYRRV